MHDGKVQDPMSRADEETITLGQNGRFPEEVTLELRQEE